MAQFYCIGRSTIVNGRCSPFYFATYDEVWQSFEGLNTLLRVCLILMLVFTNVTYNASLHHWFTTRNNKFLTKIFVVVMPSYLTFATAKLKIKLPLYFFSLIPMAADFPDSKGQMEVEQFMMSWIGLQKFADVFF